MGGGNVRGEGAEVASALRWWLEAGVDTPITEEPRDWLAKAKIPVAPAETAGPSPAAEDLPDTLDLFRDWMAQTPSLPMARAGSKRVLPQGAEHAPVMLIAEMPAADDSAAGRPISGESWTLTERMMQAIGIAPEQAYCATLSCFHAPGGRMSREELEACGAIARRHVALAKPKRLLLFGDAPSRALLGKPMTIARGHVHKVEGVRTVVTFHPRHLLNRPSDKALAWKDLLLLMEDEG